MGRVLMMEDYDWIIREPFSLRTGTAPAVDLIKLGSFRDIFKHCDRLYNYPSRFVVNFSKISLFVVDSFN